MENPSSEILDAVTNALEAANAVHKEQTAATPGFIQALNDAYSALASNKELTLSRELSIELVKSGFHLVVENHNLRERLDEAVRYMVSEHVKQYKCSLAGRS